MGFDFHCYVPCLRWKQGEYEAISQLEPEIKRMLMPLIEVPEFGRPEHGWDHETERKIKTIDKHLALFVERIYKKWNDLPFFVDLNLISPTQRMKNGIHPISFIFKELRGLLGSRAVPVTSLTRDSEYQREVKTAVANDKNGVALRISIEQAAKNTFKAEADSLLSTFQVQLGECDFILDLGALKNFLPLNGLATAIQVIMSKIPYLNEWRTFTLLGTSFPETMGSIKKEEEIIQRFEWQLYKILITNLGRNNVRLPAFGDYAINHPKVSEVDMRTVNTSANIRYTIDNSWFIVKGNKLKKNKKDKETSVKDKKYGFGQYRDLSKRIINSKYYFRPTFSWGDEYIQKCATGKSGTGNLSTWRRVGTSHHIVKVMQDIASFYASSSSL